MTLLDPIFKPLLVLNPYLIIVIIIILLTTMHKIISYLICKPKLMEKRQKKTERQQKKLSKLKGQELLKYQAKYTQFNLKFALDSVKPMLIVLIPALFIFRWMQVNMGYLNVFGLRMRWFWVYLVMSLIVNVIYSKILSFVLKKFN